MFAIQKVNLDEQSQLWEMEDAMLGNPCERQIDKILLSMVIF